MSRPDWDIPHHLQPRAAGCGFDLEATLRGIVALRADVPADAFTAGALGTERSGNGVVTRDGLVLTMGYLVMEAESIWLSTHDGRVVAGHALAVDTETGFGLVQPLGRLDLPQVPLCGAGSASVGGEVVLAASGGRHRAIETRIVGCQEFAGYWEYLLEEAIFTAPAHPFWGGAALLDRSGALLGVGSLILQQGDGKGRRIDMNMAVPTALLPPIWDDLVRFGRVNRPARPWIGMYAMDSDETVVVGEVVEGGPADRAGVRAGDRVLAIADHDLSDLAGLWRLLWRSGEAGVTVRLSVSRDDELLHFAIASADRTRFLRAPRLH